MSLQTQLIGLANAVGGDIKTVWSLINGKAADLDGLTTTSKSTLVAAINEVKAAADIASSTGGAEIDDASQTTTEAWSSSKIRTELDATQAVAATQAVDAITNGAGAAYDTLLELQSELQDNDSAIANIVSAQANRLAVDQAQAFTTAQKLQACQNAGVGDPETDFTAAYATARDA